jgi:putative MATE family efflux protein
MFPYISRDKTFYKTALALSGPLVLQNLINNSMSMLDTFMVGSLGEVPLAGVTLANTVFFIAMLVNFGLQSGSMILISQYWGKGDAASVNRIIGIGAALSGSVSLVFTIGLTFFSENIYSLTTTDPELARVASEYARVAAASILFNGLTLIYISAQRSMGNTMVGMVILSSGMAVSTFMNWLLIYGNWGFPKMGVAGAALATLISRALELTVTAVYAMRNTAFRLEFKYLLRPGFTVFKDFITYSMPVLINETAWSVGFSLYSVIFGHMRNAAAGIAAYTITQTVERLLAAIYFGVGGAAAVLVGRPLGAGDAEKARTAGVTMLFSSVALGAVSGGLLLLLTLTFIVPVIFPIFGASGETLRAGRIMLMIAAANMPFKAFNFCNIVGVLRGGGDARAAMLLDIGVMYLFSLPLTALTGLAFHAPFVFVYLTISLEEFVKLFLGYRRFSKRKWLQNITREIPA